MRSLLFVPGGSAKMMAKAVAGGADVVILDLEDAVHPDKKEAARHLVAEALTAASRTGPLLYVRVNPLDSPWCAGDLDAVMQTAAAWHHAAETHAVPGISTGSMR